MSTSNSSDDNTMWYLGAAVVTAAAAAAGYYLYTSEDDKEEKKASKSNTSSTTKCSSSSSSSSCCKSTKDEKSSKGCCQSSQDANRESNKESSSTESEKEGQQELPLKGGSDSQELVNKQLENALSSSDPSTNIERQDSGVFFNPSSSSFIDDTPNSDYEQTLDGWTNNVAQAEQMIPLIGSLYRENNVVLHMYGRGIVNQSAVDIIKVHKFCQRYVKDKGFGNLETTLEFISKIEQLNPGPSKIDIGLLIHNYHLEENTVTDVDEYLKQELMGALESTEPLLEDGYRDVVLYGFGRIGRLLARILIHKTGGGDKLRLRAIVVRKKMDIAKDLEKRASLLRRDSTHGNFHGSITIDFENHCLIANGVRIQMIFASDPSEIDYESYGITNALVVDNTGMRRNRKTLEDHFQSKGVWKVVLTAPGKEVPNVVMGVNESILNDEDDIIAAASCTTNAVSPFLHLIHEEYGIEWAHIETVHSYTNDQNLVDNYHKKHRRGRAAATNMVITETGAASAVQKALPELEGKVTGNAIRVPTQDVSLAILNLGTTEQVNTEDLNEFLRQASLRGPLRDQVDYSSSNELVSSDLVGNKYAGVVDSGTTRADGNRANLYIWYDNEFGYSCQVIRLLQLLGGVKHPKYPLNK